jgi:hypothetical protein
MDDGDIQIPLLRPERLDPLPVDARHYVAALQSQPGERDALQHVSAEIWTWMTPLLHFVGPKTPPAAFRAQTVRNWVARLAPSVGEHPMYIDVTRLNPTHPVATRDGEAAVLARIYEASRSCGLRFVPVLWVGESSDDHRRIVADAALQDGHGVALRYRMRRYVPPLGAGHGDYVAAELTALGREPKDADLILDLEYIDPDDDLDPDGMAASLTRMLAVGPWRSVVMLGTSIPTMMSCIDEGTVGSVPRKEWELWSRLQGCGLDRMPAFGDYAIQNPHPPHDGGGPGMRANIRYTSNGATLVARGRGPFYEEGNEQYKGLCEQLVARTEFAGRKFTWGDEVIDDCAQGAVEPGGQRVWRGAGTSHHLRVVSEQLAS